NAFRRHTPSLLRSVFQFVRQGVALALDFTPTVTYVRGETLVVIKLLDVLGLGGILREGLYTLYVKTATLRAPLGRPIDPDGDGSPGGALARVFRQLPGDINHTGRV